MNDKKPLRRDAPFHTRECTCGGRTNILSRWKYPTGHMPIWENGSKLLGWAEEHKIVTIYHCLDCGRTRERHEYQAGRELLQMPELPVPMSPRELMRLPVITQDSIDRAKAILDAIFEPQNDNSE